MNPLAGFSDWVLALLPRLFFAPGGICLLLAFALHAMAKGNLTDNGPRKLLFAFLRENTAALAFAWTATALVPISGIAPLPFPIDAFSLLSLPIISLAFDNFGKEKSRGDIAGVLAITVAVLSLTLPGKQLLVNVPANAGPAWVVLGAIAVSLAALAPNVAQGANGAMRWLALGLTGMTLASSFNLGLVAATLAGCFAVGLGAAKLGWSNAALTLGCLLAALALLIRLLPH